MCYSKNKNVVHTQDPQSVKNYFFMSLDTKRHMKDKEVTRFTGQSKKFSLISFETEQSISLCCLLLVMVLCHQILYLLPDLFFLLEIIEFKSPLPLTHTRSRQKLDTPSARFTDSWRTEFVVSPKCPMFPGLFPYEEKKIIFGSGIGIF